MTLSAVQRHPERLTAFGLIHSTAYADTEEGKEKRNKAVSTIQTEGITAFVDGLVPGLFAPQHVESFSDQVLKVKEIGYKTPPQGAVGTSLAMRERSDRRDVLSASTLPTLLVAGEQDQAIPPARTFTTDRAGVTQVTISEVEPYEPVRSAGTTGTCHFGIFTTKHPAVSPSSKAKNRNHLVQIQRVSGFFAF